MDTMTFKQYKSLLSDYGKKNLLIRFLRRLLGHDSYSNYYIGRWSYFKEVINLTKLINPSSVLELGPGKHTIVHDCDVMMRKEDDCWGRPINKIRKIYFHDAIETPWPIKDKQYDLFIALQVWEHLSNKQTKAFREVMRISKNAILSFPYLWHCPKDNINYPSHHLINKKLIKDWTCNVPPQKIIYVSRSGPDRLARGRRIIYFWNFK